MWVGIGAVGTAILGIILLGESRQPLRLLSIALRPLVALRLLPIALRLLVVLWLLSTALRLLVVLLLSRALRLLPFLSPSALFILVFLCISGSSGSEKQN